MVVEAAPGKYLFAVVEEKQESLAFEAFFGAQYLNPVKAKANEIQEMRQRVELGSKLYPMLVTFSDINDPKSVKLVKPDDLASIFGPGYSLKSITLEITDEAVTEGKVEALLGWLTDPNIMENPGWKSLPILSREAIGGLLTSFPKVGSR